MQGTTEGDSYSSLVAGDSISSTIDNSDMVFNNASTAYNHEELINDPFRPFDRYIDQIPLLGYPGPVFWIIHVSAVVCLTTSTLVSITLICFLCVSCQLKDREPDSTQITDGKTPSDVKTKAVQQGKSFKKWNIGERLVIYLALTDMSFEVSHIMDHAYVMYARINPTDLACASFGFMLTEFVFAQWIIVLYTALSVCCLIVFNKKLHLGRLDWRLITVAFGSPMIIGAVAASSRTSWTKRCLVRNIYIFICVC